MQWTFEGIGMSDILTVQYLGTWHFGGQCFYQA